MKRWSSALFPLTILFTLAALTFWLRLATELPEEKHDGKFRHDPDYIVTSGVLHKLDKTGILQYTLQSSEIKHFPDDDSTELSSPHLLYQQPGKADVTMQADRGLINSGGKQIDLMGNVKITRAALGKDAEIVATTSALTILPDDEVAYTKAAVTVTQGKSKVHGTGLNINQKKQTYTLESNATATIESRHGKK